MGTAAGPLQLEKWRGPPRHRLTWFHRAVIWGAQTQAAAGGSSHELENHPEGGA
jgi:hypothetical protein